MSKTVDSSFSRELEYWAYADSSSVFFAFAFNRYSFERNRFAEVINSGISDADSSNRLKSA